MNLSAYWISNYIFDTIKALIPVVIVIGLIYAFKLDVSIPTHFPYIYYYSMRMSGQYF
jgi:hypothetical protein